MSIPVELKSLADALGRYSLAYLMTSSESGPPHAVQVDVTLQDGELLIRQAGNRTRTNAQARPAVGLLWPPQSADEYSLIVDGQAMVEGESVRIMPTRAVMHRSAPSPAPQAGGCGSDCVELGLDLQPSSRA